MLKHYEQVRYTWHALLDLLMSFENLGALRLQHTLIDRSIDTTPGRDRRRRICPLIGDISSVVFLLMEEKGE